MANKATSEKNKPARKKLRDNEYYNPKSKRYEYHYRDILGWHWHSVNRFRIPDTSV